MLVEEGSRSPIGGWEPIKQQPMERGDGETAKAVLHNFNGFINEVKSFCYYNRQMLWLLQRRLKPTDVGNGYLQSLFSELDRMEETLGNNQLQLQFLFASHSVEKSFSIKTIAHKE